MYRVLNLDNYNQIPSLKHKKKQFSPFHDHWRPFWYKCLPLLNIIMLLEKPPPPPILLSITMSAMVSHITRLTIVYSGVYSGADQRKHQSSASRAFVWEIHRWPVNSPHKRPVTRKMFPFDDVIIRIAISTFFRNYSKTHQYVMHRNIGRYTRP